MSKEFHQNHKNTPDTSEIMVFTISKIPSSINSTESQIAIENSDGLDAFTELLVLVALGTIIILHREKKKEP